MHNQHIIDYFISRGLYWVALWEAMKRAMYETQDKEETLRLARKLTNRVYH